MIQKTAVTGEDPMIFLQATLNVSRKELLDIIFQSRVSAEKIAEYVRKRSYCFAEVLK